MMTMTRTGAVVCGRATWRGAWLGAGAIAIALAAGGVGCAGGGAQETGVRGKSRPLSEVKEREAAAAEARRVAAEKARAGAAPSEGSAELPQGDAALAEWIKRAEEGGLIKADGSSAGKSARERFAAAHGVNELSDGSTAADPGVTGQGGESTPPTNTAPAKPEHTDTPKHATPAPANTAIEGVAASNTPSSVVDASMASSRPLAALVKLHAARAAGDARVTDQEIAALERTLTPKEMDFYAAWKALQASIAAGTDGGANAGGGDVTALKRAANEFAQATRGWAELRIPRVVLCTKVEGFGRYTELRRYTNTLSGGLRAGGSDGGGAMALGADEPVYTFLAGRKHKFIVYCEVDGFASRGGAAMGRSGYEVEIAQDLTLYAGGPASGFGGRDVVAWRKNDQRVKDFSLNQRRDFFMVQIVELPETLTVGGYSLKVRVRDLASSGAGEAEVVIPIDIVADASALGK